MRIDVVSPVHVGTGEKNMPFLYDEWKGNYYRYLITDLLLKMPDGLNTYSLYDDLKSFDQSKDTKKKMIDLFRKNVHYKELKSAYALKKEGNIGNNYVFEQVKALDKPIIPGSTIKGAIENAIIYCFIEDYYDECIKDELAGLIVSSPADIKKYSDEKTYLSMIFGVSKTECKEFLHDVFSCLLCSDITLSNMSIYEGLRISAKNKKGQPVGAFECISANQSAKGNFVTFDKKNKRLIKYEGMSYMEDFILMFEKENMMRACNDCFQECLDSDYEEELNRIWKGKPYNFSKYNQEIDDFRDYESETSCYIRLGKNTNWNFKGLGLLFKNLDDSFFKRNFKNLFSPTNENLKDEKIDLFPCTRTIYVTANDDAHFPGVIKLSFDD